MPQDKQTVDFLRALLRGGETRISETGEVKAIAGGRSACIPLAVAEALREEGALKRSGAGYVATPGARAWILRARERRKLGSSPSLDGAGRQASAPAETEESTLARLAQKAPGETEPFLSAHHVEAGERLRRLCERAQLRQRITMSYDLSRTAGPGDRRGAEISDMAEEARREVAGLLARLPRDCAGVVLDVCLFGKGLQLIETERRWPRRSAKLVLRIGLEQAALHWRLGSVAVGPSHGRTGAWMSEGARPTEFR